MNAPSHLLVFSFALYVLVVAGLAATALVRGGAHKGWVFSIGVLWLAFTGGLAQSGLLARFDGFPPPVLKVVILSALITISLCSSSMARG